MSHGFPNFEGPSTWKWEVALAPEESQPFRLKSSCYIGMLRRVEGFEVSGVEG